MKKTGNSIVEANIALLADLRELEQAVRPSSGEGLAELCARLGPIHARIIEHFRFEEQNGFLDVVKKKEPRLERAVHQLALEHGQLRQSLDGIMGDARAATSLGDSLRGKIREWIERLRQHESRENSLVQDAFDTDIGAED